MAGSRKNAKRKQDRRAADMSVVPEVELYEPHRPPTGDHSRTFDLNGRLSIFRGVWYDASGKVADFCICLRTEANGEYHDMVRIDCCHGEVHIHRFDQSGNEKRVVWREIVTQDDVQRGFERADDYIYDTAETAEKGWERGI